jgi:uroporphyrinogen-III synthase
MSITARAFRPPDRSAAVILTSRNAVQPCLSSLHGRPVFAVGSATAKAATEAGFSRVFDADGDAAALTSLIANTLSPNDGTLLLPVGQGQGSELAASLRQRGFRVLRRVAYQAAPVDAFPEAARSWLDKRQVATAMFFSGEASRHFVRLLRVAGLAEAIRDIEAVSISERAAVALRSLPWRRILVASKPNQDAMLALLQ